VCAAKRRAAGSARSAAPRAAQSMARPSDDTAAARARLSRGRRRARSGARSRALAVEVGGRGKEREKERKKEREEEGEREERWAKANQTSAAPLHNRTARLRCSGARTGPGERCRVLRACLRGAAPRARAGRGRERARSVCPHQVREVLKGYEALAARRKVHAGVRARRREGAPRVFPGVERPRPFAVCCERPRRVRLVRGEGHGVST
jgi:hypothetical protein